VLSECALSQGESKPVPDFPITIATIVLRWSGTRLLNACYEFENASETIPVHGDNHDKRGRDK